MDSEYKDAKINKNIIPSNSLSVGTNQSANPDMPSAYKNV